VYVRCECLSCTVYSEKVIYIMSRCIIKLMNVEKSKRLIICDGGSSYMLQIKGFD
jgi:hypothetical protein